MDTVKRIALFAHYDRDGIIDDYVIYYLRGLTGVAQRILFMSDCALKPGEAAKLDGLAELVFADRHGEYDFGSWKRGFAFLSGDLTGWDEVIIANDSCYAPVYPFEGVFARMDSIACDFWGPSALSQDNVFSHVNSCFTVFRPKAFLHSGFLQFWRDIKPCEKKKDVVDVYEKGLSQLLLTADCSWHSIIPPHKALRFTESLYVHKIVHEKKMSWIKTSVFKDKKYSNYRLSNALNKLRSHYPGHLIDAHIQRLLGTKNPHHYNYWAAPFHWPLSGKSFITVRGRVQHNKWWKFYLYIFNMRFVFFALPLFRPDNRLRR